MTSRTGGIHGLATTALTALVLIASMAVPARADIEVVGSESTLVGWLPATGPVAGYLVFVSTNGTDAILYATLPASSNFVTIQSQFGDTVVMWIGSFDSDGNNGPLSDPSPAIHFIAEIEPDIATGNYTPFDFDGDQHSDIMIRNPDSGEIAIWMMDGTRVLSTSQDLPTILDATWSAAATGDFNGDGSADLVWRNDNGAIAIWLMENGELIGGINYSLDSEWRVTGAADLDGDSRDDLIFNHTSGLHYGWLMYGLRIAGHGVIGNPGSGWTIVATPDFDLDGKADLLWQHDEGIVYAWLMDGISIASHGSVANAPAGWSVIGSPDLDGDGSSDLLWQHETGLLYAWFMNGITLTSYEGLPNPTSDWTFVGHRDFDADGRDDLLWEHETGLVYAWLMDGTTLASHGRIGSVGPGFEVVPN